MLSIRLTRTGKIHDPHYRIVVQEKRSKLDGKAIDIIGHYHPAQKDKLLVIDKEKAKEWMKKGAQPSDTVTNLFVKDGIFPKNRKLSNFYTPTTPEPKVEKAEEKAESTSEELTTSNEDTMDNEETVVTPEETTEVATDDTVATDATTDVEEETTTEEVVDADATPEEAPEAEAAA
jgi:small subunit ribosomal protein S16